MKPGRKPIPRAQRIERRLPVCRTEGCDRSPWRRDYCRTCREGVALPPAPRGPKSDLLSPGAPVVVFTFRVAPEMLARLRERAREDGVTAGELARQALSAALRVTT